MAAPLTRRVVLASGNPGKLAEFRALLAGRALELVGQGELGIADPDETGASFVENALLKARNAARRSGLAALADDSGLLVEALAGAPGLYSARYAGPAADAAANNARLLQELAGVPPERRGACFVAVVVYLRGPDDTLPLIAQGCWPGRILEQPRGSGGFGYDPLFLDLGLGLSAAELEASVKHRLSHRGQAFRHLLEQWPDGA